MLKKIILAFLLLGALTALLTFTCNWWVRRSASGQLYDQVEALPYNRVALVLGTGKHTRGGYLNPYFSTRIRAAAELYRAGKVEHFIVSGDNSRKGYNEPADMREALVDQGVPATAITLDYAGFRTLDSVVRCKEVFRQERFTIVSQPFHNIRALFIANHYGLETVAFAAAEVPSSRMKIWARELLARTKAVLDLYVLKTQPRYLGEEVEI
ncbi:MAG: YdcF family protein [Phaeodactylibacter sp.]|nr:YdcF family protein [Phaeodactylibacter sp.]